MFDRCPISLFLFNLNDERTGDALGGIPDAGIELTNGEKLHYLEYAGNLACLLGTTEYIQRALNRIARAVVPFGMRYASSKDKVMLHDWTTAVPSLVLDGE